MHIFQIYIYQTLQIIILITQNSKIWIMVLFIKGTTSTAKYRFSCLRDISSCDDVASDRESNRYTKIKERGLSVRRIPTCYLFKSQSTDFYLIFFFISQSTDFHFFISQSTDCLASVTYPAGMMSQAIGKATD